MLPYPAAGFSALAPVLVAADNELVQDSGWTELQVASSSHEYGSPAYPPNGNWSMDNPHRAHRSGPCAGDNECMQRLDCKVSTNAGNCKARALRFQT